MSDAERALIYEELASVYREIQKRNAAIFQARINLERQAKEFDEYSERMKKRVAELERMLANERRP